MSEYLSILVARSSGELTVVEPRLAYAFEPAQNEPDLDAGLNWAAEPRTEASWDDRPQSHSQTPTMFHQQGLRLVTQPLSSSERFGELDISQPLREDRDLPQRTSSSASPFQNEAPTVGAENGFQALPQRWSASQRLETENRIFPAEFSDVTDFTHHQTKQVDSNPFMLAKPDAQSVQHLHASQMKPASVTHGDQVGFIAAVSNGEAIQSQSQYENLDPHIAASSVSQTFAKQQEEGTVHDVSQGTPVLREMSALMPAVNLPLSSSLQYRLGRTAPARDESTVEESAGQFREDATESPAHFPTIKPQASSRAISAENDLNARSTGVLIGQFADQQNEQAHSAPFTLARSKAQAVQSTLAWDESTVEEPAGQFREDATESTTLSPSFKPQTSSRAISGENDLNKRSAGASIGKFAGQQHATGQAPNIHVAYANRLPQRKHDAVTEPKANPQQVTEVKSFNKADPQQGVDLEFPSIAIDTNRLSRAQRLQSGATVVQIHPERQAMHRPSAFHDLADELIREGSHTSAEIEQMKEDFSPSVKEQVIEALENASGNVSGPEQHLRGHAIPRVRFEEAGVQYHGLKPLPTPVGEAQSAQPSTAPTIYVTIGRVEVRATPAPAQPVRKTSSSSAISLDEYMHQRAGGLR